MEFPSQPDETGRDIYSFHNVVAYVTLCAGYLLGIMTANALNLPLFLMFTALHLVWLWLFLGLDSQGGESHCVLINVAMIVVAVASLGLARFGVGFDWLLPMATVGVSATVFSVRISALLTAGMWFLTLATLVFVDRGLTPNTWLSAFSLSPAFVFVFGFSYAVREQIVQRERAEGLVNALERSNADLEEAHAQLRAYTDQVEELTVTRERNRMAREIHDTLGHYLTILAVKLETASKLEARGDSDLAGELAEARRVASECLAEVRHAVSALRPADPTATSFSEAIRRLAVEFESASEGTMLTLDLEGEAQPLAPETRLALYRAVQESLTNIRKHADATKVLLRLRVDDRHAELTVLDNGQRTPVHDKRDARGFGLLGMRERVALLGGTAQAGPASGQGWRVEVIIPRYGDNPARDGAIMKSVGQEIIR